MRGAISAFVALLALAQISMADPATATLPVPDVNAQADAWKNIHDVYKDQYAKKGVADEIALSQTLLDQANQTHDDPVSRYVMLRESRDLAAAAGDIDQSIKAAAQMQADYQVDRFDVRMPALKMAATHVQSGEQAAGVINACRSQAEQAFDANRLDVAQSCGKLAGFAADRVTDSGVMLGARHLQRWIAATLAEAPAAKETEKDLTANPAVNPNDPDKNLIVGKYYVLTRGDFAKGLPFLSRSSNAEMKSLALAELGQSPDPDQVVKIGDGWWELGEKSQDWEKIHLHAHAVQLYNSVIDRLSGITATKVKARIDAAKADDTSVSPTAINLLRAASLPARSVTGEWKFDRGQLQSSGKGREIVSFGYLPPDEYDVECEFMRLSGDDDINLILCTHGKTFFFDMGGWHNTVIGADTIGGKRARDMAESIKGQDLIPIGKPMKVIVKVRHNDFQAVLNGNIVYRIASDYGNWDINQGDWDKADIGAMGLAIQNSSVLFQSFKVTEISGRGKAVAARGEN